ncbi:hypothetical protein SAMN05421640_0476 [Ekhidna lutea]|uniref:Uncharacterized protein n=1 Tax=Ekhidna lutea TaxID=447679 RepID=A0A239F3S6_EKHLU|nr:hypothetical protein [Ekhidna lutea]SNS51539.1 hypothetical protein SAMN05421640_0476 [Ekhidna lutea]
MKYTFEGKTKPWNQMEMSLRDEKESQGIDFKAIEQNQPEKGIFLTLDLKEAKDLYNHLGFLIQKLEE